MRKLDEYVTKRRLIFLAIIGIFIGWSIPVSHYCIFKIDSMDRAWAWWFSNHLFIIPLIVILAVWLWYGDE